MQPHSTPETFFARIQRHRLTSTFTLLGTLTVGILAGSVLTRDVGAAEQNVSSSDARPLQIPSPVTLSNGFSQIAKQVGPAVVNINTEEIPKKSTNPRGGNSRRNPHGFPAQPGGNGDDQQGGGNGDMQDFLNRFFGGQNPGGNGGDDEGGMDGGERQALGSGFIVDPRGYIITNNHVVDKADRIFVKLASEPDNGDGPLSGHPATVVGVDPETDIAVIKIDTKEPLPTVKLGNSDGAQVGDWVLAIGSPFGLTQTVSAGIVSAKNRSIDGPRRQWPGPAVSEVYPDRRRHQPRQLRRPAGRYGRSGSRHEHRDLYPIPGIPGRGLRHAVQHHRPRLQRPHQPCP